MKKICMLLIFIFAVLMFTACGSSDKNYDYQIFYINKAENQLIAEGYNAEATTINGLVDELMNQMNTLPDDDDAQTPGLDITYILNYEYTLEGYLVLNFDADYFTLPDIKETLCRAAIVKTLCQIDGIKGVEFTIDGEPYKDVTGNAYGYMSAETFVDNTSGVTTYKQTMSVNLYFANHRGDKLDKVPINVTFDGTISLEELIVQQIIKGPSNVKGADESLKPVVLTSTVINQITVREQICYIDLSQDFLTAVSGVSKSVSLYAVVNALVDLPDINKVQFTIDGKTVKYFGDSDIVFDAPLERKLEIIENN